MVQQSTSHPEPEWSGSVQHAHSLPDHPGSLLKTIQGNRGGPLPFDVRIECSPPSIYRSVFVGYQYSSAYCLYCVYLCYEWSCHGNQKTHEYLIYEMEIKVLKKRKYESFVSIVLFF